MASSSSSSITPQIKHDVFLSFRGEDIRYNFISHLRKALSEKCFATFIDEELERGNEISSSLLQAIEESHISVIIFSKGYASSKWCLEELVKILECKEKSKQRAIPVFYEVDPSDVRNQKGSFADAFAKHEESFNISLDKVQTWKDALQKAANLSGMDSRVIKPDSKLIEHIVQDVQKRLSAIYSTYNADLIGIDSRIKELESILESGSNDIYTIGIWGIGGIGKTTLAEAIFDKMSSKFGGSYFVRDIREKSELSGGLDNLRQQLMCAILGDKSGNIVTFSTGGTFNNRMLGRSKLLIVFDDVTKFKQIKTLIGCLDCLKLGSRIIITSRDKQVLENCKVDKIYKVEELSFVDALQLFCRHAFGKNCLMEDYEKLSKELVSYVGGVPLALEVLGSSLFGKRKQVWESAMKKLKNILHEDIQNVLKVSYDKLDLGQQDIILDIACFFKGWHVNIVKSFLDACGFFAEVEINVLIDKSLIKISNEKLRMHDLLQAMGRSIVKKESINDPGKRNQLWYHDEIYRVLTTNTETDTIQDWRNDNKVHAPQGLKSISTELRYLHWYQCPLKSLQSNIHPEKLVELDMPESNVENLWSGVQQLVNLKKINFYGSKKLTSCPDLSRAQSLESLNLSGCMSLLSIPSSIRYLTKLQDLHLRDCTSLMSLPDCTDTKSLIRLHLSNCLNLKILPELPLNLEYLEASNTSIEELPSSIAVLSRLSSLYLRNCSKLKCLPNSICNWKSLKNLCLVHCSKLDKLPDDIGTLKSLRTLLTTGTVIRELPSSMGCLKNLKESSFGRIKGQDTMGCLLPHLSGFRNLTELSLRNCGIRKIPYSTLMISCLSLLRYLDLSRNNFESIPASILNLSNLDTLNISNCKRLKFLPKLPFINIDIWNCTKLEKLSGFSFRESIMRTDRLYVQVEFLNCFKLDRSILEDIAKDVLWKMQSLATLSKEGDYKSLPRGAQVYYPGHEIPTCFTYKNTGSTINVKLPSDWFNSDFVGFAYCVVVEFGGHHVDECVDIIYTCTFISKDGNPSVVDGDVSNMGYARADRGSNHVFMGFDDILCPRNFSYDNEVSFHFYVKNLRSIHLIEHHKVEMCGVRLMYAQHLEESNDSLTTGEAEGDMIEESDGSLGTCEEEDVLFHANIKNIDQEHRMESADCFEILKGFCERVADYVFGRSSNS